MVKKEDGRSSPSFLDEIPADVRQLSFIPCFNTATVTQFVQETVGIESL